MDISIFSVIGPVMTGPSSSHTAGAARLARVARLIAARPFVHVAFGLHGSFAKTYKGHGTDRALLAGALGLREDDARLADAFVLAEQAGITWEFREVELEGMHENSVQIDFSTADGDSCRVVGSSIGGGQIVINSINGFETEFTAEAPTLIIRQRDKRGVIREVTGILADSRINIGVMKLSRKGKGGTACCIIETDDCIGQDVVERIRALEHIDAVQALNTGEE